MPKRGRSSQLNAARNIVLITRYWYWTVIWQRRHESILESFEKDEFFLRPAVVNIILRNDTEVYKHLMETNPSVKDLSTRFPAFRWEENPLRWQKKVHNVVAQAKLF